MAGEVKSFGSDELVTVLEQLPEGVVIVDHNASVLFANKPGCKLIKLKPKTAVGSTFAHDIEDGNMRDFDVEMTVKDITWSGEPAKLLHLKSLKSSGAFHLEWKLEAALERAREAEEVLAKFKEEAQSAVQAVETGADEAPAVDLSYYEERIAELESLLELAEVRADELHSGSAFEDHQMATELQDAIAQAREAEEQLRDLEDELAGARERIRLAEEQAEVAEERAYSLEAELEELHARTEDGEDHSDSSAAFQELERRYQDLVSERDTLQAELANALTVRQSAEQLSEDLESRSQELEEARSAVLRVSELETELIELKAQLEQAQLESSQARTELESRLQAKEQELEALHDKFQALESGADASAELAEKLSESESTIAALRQELEEVRDQAIVAGEESEELAEQLRVEQEQFVAERDSLKQQLEEREQTEQALRAEVEASAQMAEELEAAKVAKEGLEAEVEQLRADLEAAENERDSMLVELEEAARATEERSVEALELQQKVTSLEASSNEVEQLKKENRRLQTLLEDAEELAQKGEKVEKLERKLEGALRRAEEAEERLAEERRLLAEAKQKLEKLTNESRDGMPGEGANPETERLAFQDELTGLPNRNIIQRYLGFMLKQSARYGRLTAMLRVDCDNFKTINDTFGSEVGDQLIRGIGERLSSVVRGSDVLGRYAEDEFIMLLSEMADQDEATVITATVIKRLYQKMKKPFVVGDQNITVEVSVGVSLYPLDAKNGEQMFEHATVALKRAKDTGRGTAQYFTADLQTAHVARNDMEQELKTALDKKQFELFYQPIFDLASGQIVGMESLLRWNHPTHGRLIPKHFLQIAEDSGIIVLIGHWILREVLTRALEWHKAKLTEFISVNMTRRQLLQADLLPTIQAVLSEVGCSPERLLLEVPENLTGAELPQVRETLVELQKMGVRLAVDNFGTASSSLKDLRRGPFQVLKVDRSFVAGVPKNDELTGILLSALTVGHHLGRIAIAVGVENQQQKEWLIKTGCRFAQGNALSEPLSTQQLEELIKARKG